MHGKGARKTNIEIMMFIFWRRLDYDSCQKSKIGAEIEKIKVCWVWKVFLGVSWATWWQVVGEMRAKIAPRGAKMSPRGAKMSPRGAKMSPRGAKISQLDAKLEESCGQEAPRSTQEAHVGVLLRASWTIWRAFW